MQLIGQDVLVSVAQENLPESIVAVLLAAGSGSRFFGKSHKLLTPLPSNGGLTIFETALQQVLAASFVRIVVVTGAIDIPLGMLKDPRVHVAHNSRWETGQASSVAMGIAEAQHLGATAVVIGLADQPFVTSEAWHLVAQSPSPIAVATYRGIRGNPVRIDQSVWPLLPHTGDSGAREIIRLRPELVSQVDCPGSAADIDTQEDLAQWT